MKKVALFDVCHTLVSTSTIREFTEEFLLSPKQNPAFRVGSLLNHIVWKIMRRLHIVSNESYRNHFKKILKNYKADDIAKLGSVYALHLEKKFKKEIVGEFQQLKNKGYEMWLVSAGFDVYLIPFAQYLGAKLVCSILEIDNAGSYTGQLSGVDCYGEGKVEKLKSVLNFQTIDWKESSSFGDHGTDIPMMNLTGNACAVNPDLVLKNYAREYHWRIVSINTRIKILYLITGLGVGGAEANLRDLVVGLDKNRFDVTVVSILPIGSFGQEMIKKGIRVVDISGWSKYDPRIILSLVRILHKERPDILHTQLFHADMLGRLSRLFVKIPFVVSSLQNMTFGGKLHEIFLSATHMVNDYWIAVSKLVLDNAVAKKIANVKASVVIYNAVDTVRFGAVIDKDAMRKKLGIPNNKKILVTTGRLIPQKGFHDLIDAMHGLHQSGHKDFMLYMLGEGYLRKELEATIASRDMDNVTLVGVTKDVKEYLAAADLFVMSSHWEGCPVALVEAVIASVPSITTPVGVVMEFIVEKETGFLVPIGDAKALEQKIIECFSMSQENLTCIGSQGSQIATSLFSVNTMVDKHEELYEKLFSKNNK